VLSALERQEEDGQRYFMSADILPKEINGTTREGLSAIGFVFGSDADDLFVECRLPFGWTKRATEHAMHSHLIDERGRKRASVFYKASSHDRRADISMMTRYTIDLLRSKDGCYMVAVDDCEKIMMYFGESSSRNWEFLEKLRENAEEWLDAELPEWRDPMAYWQQK